MLNSVVEFWGVPDFFSSISAIHGELKDVKLALTSAVT